VYFELCPISEEDQRMAKTDQPYRQRLEARMIDIAERLMEAEGLAAVQARRVTGEADCSVGTLYNVFGGLDGLILAVNSETLKRLGERLGAATRAAMSGSLEDRLLALAFAYRDFAVEQQTRWRALFEHRMAGGADVPEAYRAHQAQLFVLVEQVIADVIKEPAARASAARALFSAVHGIVALSLESRLGPYNAEETEQQLWFIVSNASRGLVSGR
jgi:AcrR family transcriptional regulator